MKETLRAFRSGNARPPASTELLKLSITGPATFLPLSFWLCLVDDTGIKRLLARFQANSVARFFLLCFFLLPSFITLCHHLPRRVHSREFVIIASSSRLSIQTNPIVMRVTNTLSHATVLRILLAPRVNIYWSYFVFARFDSSHVCFRELEYI